MKPIIAFDLDGTIIDSSVSEKAHDLWFKMVGEMLGDSSVVVKPQSSDYFPEVMKLMERLTGLHQNDGFDNGIMIKYARNLFQMLYLVELRKQGKDAFVPDMLDMIIDMKSKCRLALITASPEDMVLPALDIVGLKKFFDYVYRGSLNHEPSNVEILKKFIRDVGKPALYIGNELKDAEACKELGVKFALAKWGKHDADAGALAAYNISSPKQLRGVLELL